MTDYPKYVIDISSVRELKGYIMDVNLILGAGMPLTEMMEIFGKLSSENEDFGYLKEFCNHLDLVAHIPVRNVSNLHFLGITLFCSTSQIAISISENFFFDYKNT